MLQFQFEEGKQPNWFKIRVGRFWTILKLSSPKLESCNHRIKFNINKSLWQFANKSFLGFENYVDLSSTFSIKRKMLECEVFYLRIANFQDNVYRRNFNSLNVRVWSLNRIFWILWQKISAAARKINCAFKNFYEIWKILRMLNKIFLIQT